MLWLILATVTAASGQDLPAQSCTHIFRGRTIEKSQPIPLDVSLKLAYPVIDQGTTGACWSVEGAEVFTAFFRQLGFLKPNERLSYEFYYHARMANLLESTPRHLTTFMKVDEFMEAGGAYSTDFFALVQQYGLVTEAEYQAIPKLLKGTKFGSVAYRKRMISAVRKIRSASTWKEGRQKFLETVGDIDQFQSNPDVNSGGFNPLYILRTRSPGGAARPFVEPVDLLLDGIKASLDAGLPIVADIDVNWENFAKLSRRETSVGLPYLPRSKDQHAMLILGYQADEHGKVQYVLVKNSWGPSWGDDGFVIMDREFLDHYLSDVEQFGTVQEFRNAWQKFNRMKSALAQ